MIDGVALGELVDEGVLWLGDGYRTRADELGVDGFPILRVSEVRDGHIVPSFKDHVRGEFRGKMGRKLSEPGDVIVTTKGTVGRVAMLGENEGDFVYSPQLCFFRVLARHQLMPRWLYCWLRSTDFQDQVQQVATQTDMAPYINLRDLRRIRIDVPPMAVQARVSDVLGALEEKIGSNAVVRHRATALGAATLQSVSAEMRSVPIRDVGSAHKGLSYKGAHLADEGMPMVNLANAATFGGFKRTGWKYYTGPYQPRHVAHGGDLLVANTEQTWRNEILGWPMLLPGDVPEALFSHHITRVDFAPEWQHLRLPVWAHLFTTEARQRLEGMAHGTTVAALPKEALTDLEVPVLPADAPVLRQAEALLQRAWAAERESEALVRLRDALLPGLMSGEIRVREAEERVGEVV